MKAKTEIGAVLHLVPDGIRLPLHGVHEAIAMAFKRGASYVLECPDIFDAPSLPAVRWPQDTLIAKPAVRELMENAFVYGAVYALRRRAGSRTRER